MWKVVLLMCLGVEGMDGKNTANAVLSVVHIARTEWNTCIMTRGQNGTHASWQGHHKTVFCQITTSSPGPKQIHFSLNLLSLLQCYIASTIFGEKKGDEIHKHVNAMGSEHCLRATKLGMVMGWSSETSKELFPRNEGKTAWVNINKSVCWYPFQPGNKYINKSELYAYMSIHAWYAYICIYTCAYAPHTFAFAYIEVDMHQKTNI